MMAFTKATKAKAKLRMAITGPSGAGKTMTALRIASGLGGKIAVIDSEHLSASKYADRFDFDTCDLNGKTNPAQYIEAIREAESAGYSVVIIDSMTHAWEATKEFVDRKKAASNSGNGFTAWADGTKLWNSLQDAIQGSSVDVIATMRSKVDYSQEVENGKKVVKKLGMAPEVRDGTEFAYDVVLDMDCDHNGRVSKTRCDALDGYFEAKPGEALGKTLREWLSDGVELATAEQIAQIQRDLKECRATRYDWETVMRGTRAEKMTRAQHEELTQVVHVIRSRDLEPGAAESTTTTGEF